MRYLFNEWDKLKECLKDKGLFIFLDYDGTLTPIKRTPAQAVMPAEARAALKRLSQKRRHKVAIISGRSLKDIKKIVGVRGILYAGNHGLEMEGPKIAFRHPVSSAYTAILKRVKRELACNLAKIKGALIEDKGFTLSAHFRRVKAEDVPLLKTIFYDSVRSYVRKKNIRVTFGKKVFEIRPALQWDKGKAAARLLAHSAKPANSRYGAKDALMPVYIGDDATDEDAFKALKKRGVTVFAGKPSRSKAKYYLKNSREVIKFLKMVSLL